MKTMHSLRLALAGTAALLTQSAFAQSWQTVDDFQFIIGKASFATGLAKDPSGNLYAAGDGEDAAGTYHALAMKSSDGGATWTTIDDFFDPGTSSGDGPGYDAGIAADSAGNLYAAGYDVLPGFVRIWFVRRSVDGGLTWSTTDSFAPGGSATSPHSLATDAAGNVYVVGVASNSATSIIRKGIPDGGGGIAWSTVNSTAGGAFQTTQTYSSAIFCHPTAGVFVAGHNAGTAGGKGQKSTPGQWIVRRSLDGGATWATVDAYLLDSSVGAGAHGVGADAAGNIYAVGVASQPYNNRGDIASHWIVRKSSNGGVTWATVDNFQTAPNLTADPHGFGYDSHGNLFVIGERFDPVAHHWVVRENVGGTGTWSTVDDFQYLANKSSTGRALLRDSAGNMFAAGFGNDASNVIHWIVRSLPAP